MSSAAYSMMRGVTKVTKQDAKRLYKELMKAAMQISNPKLRVVAYDSVRTEFKVRMHLMDEFAKTEALTKGITALETLRDTRTHPFLYLNEEGILQQPLIEDPNAPTANYVPGPVLSVVWTLIFFGIGGFVFGIINDFWKSGGANIGAGYLNDPATRPKSHKGLPAYYEGNEMEWKYQPPTGPEITDFRNSMMNQREYEALLEAELLNLEAKVFATGIMMKEEYGKNPEAYMKKEIEEERAEREIGEDPKKRFWLF
eukprot:TRINITY_DN19390_c0_g1_i1.p1 TRINITY_DN19390_c0_g1~~TRINITY_DN19390_c0_g1_i1.p1  ORF type:complete len:270 (+),score=36.99 TRINITY_DN19390_c0_g1_i1:45-812(+)